MKSKLYEKALGLAQAARSKSLVVAVMGQTGVGKSSLINSLFGTNLKTDSVRPCTKEVERVRVSSRSGHEIVFCDLPGLGESDAADSAYIQEYVAQIRQSDVLLWAINSDSRSVTFERQCLARIAAHLDSNEASDLPGRIVVVLTKADVLASPPWILAVNGNNGSFVPSEEIESLFLEKSLYFQEELFSQSASSAIRLYVGPHSPISDHGVESDGDHIRCQSPLNENQLRDLRKRFPQQQAIVNTIRDTLRPVVCSARFRFNLAQVLFSTASRLPREASLRFRDALDLDDMNQVPTKVAARMGNITVYDMKTDTTIGGIETLVSESEGR